MRMKEVGRVRQVTSYTDSRWGMGVSPVANN